MSLSPVTFPLRFGVRAARSATSLALFVPQRALGLMAGLVRSQAGGSTSESPTAPPAPRRPPAGPRPRQEAAEPPARNGSEPTATDPRSAAAAVAIPPPPAPPPASTIDPPTDPEVRSAESHTSESSPLDGAPTHVTTETTLVESFAEPGAQDGAGAQITIDPPWPGYEQLGAADIIDRMRSAEPGELSLIALYEAAHRNRRTVLAATERELRSRN